MKGKQLQTKGLYVPLNLFRQYEFKKWQIIQTFLNSSLQTNSKKSPNFGKNEHNDPEQIRLTNKNTDPFSITGIVCPKSPDPFYI